MWEKAVQASSRRVVGIRVTDNAGEVAKYITKPGAYLNLDGNGAWWCDPDRLETLHTIPVFLCRSIYRSGRDIEHRRVHALYWRLAIV